jgi:hypothetical protein
VSDAFKPLNGKSRFNRFTTFQTETLHMQIKLVSSSLVAQSFIVVAACVAAPLFCASRASADTSGFVTAWGNNDYDQCNIPAAAATSGVSAIASACNAAHTIALKDGAVLAWGYNKFGQCNIPAAAQSGVSAIAGGGAHTIALKNGAVLAWGHNWDGQCTIPNSFIRGVYAIAGGGYHTIALNRDIPSYQAEIAALSSQNTALTAQLNCGDLNGDGEVNGADLGRMLISWGQCQ